MNSTTLNLNKLFSAFCIVAIGLYSCNKDLSINFDTDLNQTKSIHIDQTSGSAISFSDSSTVKLENDDTREYLDRIEAIESINSFTYQFKNFSGDPAGVMSFDIVLNGKVIEHQDNIIIQDESDSERLFEVSDEAQLTEIANGLLQDQKLTFVFSGSAQCDAAPMDFDMNIKMNIAVAANPLN
ncbi:hypothetical protein N9P55_00705 [bacterium]|nr:hypothetical protein [bacterium]MDB4089481.1 hypothetical protein [Flavobacteriales bacterium]